MWHPTVRRLSLLVLVAAGGASVACGGGPPPPGRVYVVDRPPIAPVEVRGAIPGPGWVWIPGRYHSQPGGFLWESGHWDRLPRGKKRWERGHWAHERRGWYWVEGRWR
jgi:hypothetical protein